MAIPFLDRYADNVIVVHLLRRPEADEARQGADEMQRDFGHEVPVTIVIADLNKRPNGLGYVIPSLSIASDWLYGAL